MGPAPPVNGVSGGICTVNPPMPVPIMQNSAIARPGQQTALPSAMGIRAPVQSNTHACRFHPRYVAEYGRPE